MRKGEKFFRELENIESKYLEEGYMNMKKKKKYVINSVAAILALLIILPNVSTSFAKTLAEVPLIGKIFEVVTIVNFEDKNENNEIDVLIPKIKNEAGNTSVGVVNDMIKIYSDQLIEQFYVDINESKGSLNVDYKIVTNSDTWFTITIDSVQIQASGYERRHYYNINKVTGEYVTFSEIFSDFSNSKALINENIIDQMNLKMLNEDITFFIKAVDDSGFESVSENQNFYFNENNELVISFNEYEVAPGYMGIVEFVLPYELIK